MSWWSESDSPKACFAFIFVTDTYRKQRLKCSCYLNTIVIARKGAAWDGASTTELRPPGQGSNNPMPPLATFILRSNVSPATTE